MSVATPGVAAADALFSSRSATWAGAGVICDAVSAQVLVLNLPLTGNAPAVRLCHAAPGEPVWLTLRSLRGAWELARGAEVFVCENPTVLEAAADRYGASSRPLVCTFGLPSQASWELLTGLGDVRCHVRADGDVVGWRIVNQLRAGCPVRSPGGCRRAAPPMRKNFLRICYPT